MSWRKGMRGISRGSARGASLAGLLAVAALLVGCFGPERVDTPRARTLAALAYPEDAQRGPALDIVVVRDGDTIRLANRTPEAYERMQLWLNRQYVSPIRRVAIGTDNVYELEHFINRYQEPFPRGGGLAPERRRPVLLAELYDPEANVRYPLLATPPREALLE